LKAHKKFKEIFVSARANLFRTLAEMELKMLSNFLICLNGILPIFLLILAGNVFKRIKFIDDGFASKANNLVFNAAIPCVLFYDISTTNIKSQFDLKLVSAAIGATVIMFFIAFLLSLAVTKENKKRAAFAQGVFRSNYAILGIPLTKALFEESIAANASVILAISIPLFNVLAVILLTGFLGKKRGIGGVLAGVAKNPLIIAAALGVLVSIFKIPIPEFIMKTIFYIAQMCTPLSLIVIGASFTAQKAKGTVLLSVVASFIKTFIVPALFVYPAYLYGVEGPKLGVLFIFLAAPAAVSSYVMTRNMGGDYDLVSNIIMISTAMSFFSFFIGMMIMKTIGIF